MNKSPLNMKQLLALTDIRDEIGKQLPHCPKCNTDQVQLIDHLTDPLRPKHKCRHCRHSFTTAPRITINALMNGGFHHLYTGKILAMESKDFVHIGKLCKQGCCFNDRDSNLILMGTFRYATEEEIEEFNKPRPKIDIDWFDLYS